MRKTSLSIQVLTALAAAVVVLGVAYAVMLARATARLRQAYADLQKDGRPMQAADVIPAKVPDMRNGAVLYESAALLLKGQPSPEVDRAAEERDRPGVKDDLLGYLGDLARSFAGGTLDPNQHVELRQLMGRQVVTSALATIEEGARRPTCRFRNDYDAGGSMLHPHLLDLRALAGIVGARACLEARAGQPQAAWDLAQTQVRIADGLRMEPTLMSQLTRLGLVGLSCRTIQTLAATTTPSEQQYEHLMGLLDTLDDVRPLVLAIDGERLLIGEWLFRLPKEQLHRELHQFLLGDSWPESLQRLWLLRVTFKPFLLSDHAALLQYMREYARLFEQPYSVEQRDSLERKWSAALRRHMLTSSLTPALGRIREIHCRAAADVRITRTGLALLRYRPAHGGFPATLDALGLRDVSDPFTGKPLRYRIENQGFVLYSVGEDLKDNGGSPRSPRRGKQPAECDLVWRFPDPQGES
jgi:hypothetical protein